MLHWINDVGSPSSAGWFNRKDFPILVGSIIHWCLMYSSTANPFDSISFSSLSDSRYPEERKIISVDNDSPPPPYSPPQNVDALAQSLGSLNIPPASRSRGRHDVNTNNSSLTHSRPARTAPTSNSLPPPIAAR